MSGLLQLRRQTYAAIKALTAVSNVGEPQYATDTGDLFIGDGVNIGGGASIFAGLRRMIPGGNSNAPYPVVNGTGAYVATNVVTINFAANMLRPAGIAEFQAWWNENSSNSNHQTKAFLSQGATKVYMPWSDTRALAYGQHDVFSIWNDAGVLKGSFSQVPGSATNDPSQIITAFTGIDPTKAWGVTLEAGLVTSGDTLQLMKLASFYSNIS